MRDAILEDLTAFIPPLLQALEAGGFVGRHLHPPQLAEVLDALGEPDAPLRAERGRLDAWPDEMGQVKTLLAGAADATLAAFEGLRDAAETGELTTAFRALGQLPRAQEALYPLAPGLPPVNRFFLNAEQRDDGELQVRLANPNPDTGVTHIENDRDQRGGVSLYVPETYDPAVAHPLVVALHGGSGHGRAFLWTWLRDARSRGAILLSPTAVGRTWALTGEDPDTPNLMRMVEVVRRRWNVDPQRILLTGMSDGGTFSYVSGLEPASPFTHLAPISAAFHPMLAQMADGARLAGLPIHIAHGALDWMFPVEMAQEAARALEAAGAAVTYREINDLSHTYPRELNGELITWLGRPRR